MYTIDELQFIDIGTKRRQMRKIILASIFTTLLSCVTKNKKDTNQSYYFESEALDIEMLDEIDIDDLPEADDEDEKKQAADKEQ
jgi:hypothetical protein